MEPSDATQERPDITQTVTALLSLVERQQVEMREVRDALLAEAKSAASWRAQAEALEQRLNDMRAELERARRPWWRRWFG